MAEAAADTIRAGTEAARELSHPNTLMAMFAAVGIVFALVGIGGCAFLVYRTEQRADAQIAVMQAMEKRMGGIEGEQKELRHSFTAAGIHVRLATPAVARDPE